MYIFLKKVATPVITATYLFAILLNGASSAYAQEEKTYYFLNDHLGNVDVILDEDGNVVERADYLPYGDDRLRIEENNAPDTDYGFTGKELDKETGLYYYGARYYDSTIGRFISEDPWEGDLANPQTLNKYSYAINNPIFYIDPTGMYVVETGEVEEGDTLSGITNQLNEQYGTNYSYKDIASINNIANPDKIKIGQTIRIGTLDGWQPPVSASGFNGGDWDGLMQEQQQIMNIHKNFYQSNLPGNLNQLNENEWSQPKQSIAHNIGTSGNVEVRGKGVRLGQQAVYNSITGERVDSPENMGTFDLSPPTTIGGLFGHLKMDVTSWINWGNSPSDTTTYAQRVGTMAQTIRGRAALVYYSYLKSREQQ